MKKNESKIEAFLNHTRPPDQSISDVNEFIDSISRKHPITADSVSTNVGP